jgi:hypothetical protein
MPVRRFWRDTTNAMPASLSETQSHSKNDRLILAAKAVPPAPTIVVYPCDEVGHRVRSAKCRH